MPNVGDIIRAEDFNGAGIEAGAVVPFYNVTLSGRYPIFWGKSEADTSWLVCDGGSDLHGGNVPNLSNRFIMGVTSVSAAKKTGGSTTTSSTSTGGSIGATTITSSTSGSHNHIIGKMTYSRTITENRISNLINNNVLSIEIAQSEVNRLNVNNISGAGCNRATGTANSLTVFTDIHVAPTSQSNITTGAISGGSGSHTHSFTGSSHTHTITPPYYTLIYLVKLP